jgi:hypothetical protein
MGLINESFHLVHADGYNKNDPKLLPLSRKIADELVLLSVLMPFAVCDIAVPFARKVYCTDASIEKGAVLEADVTPRTSEVLWRTSRSKGAYSRLLSPVEVVLKRLDALEEKDIRFGRNEVSRPLAFSFEFIEVFAGAAKITSFLHGMGISCGPPIDLSFSEELDLRQQHVMSWLTYLVKERRILGLFISPPCTTFSIMRRPRLRSREHPFGFQPYEPRTRTGTLLAMRGLQLMYVGARNDCCGIFEIPHAAYTKHLPAWKIVSGLPQSQEVRTDSCRFGSPHLKSFRFLGLRLDMRTLAQRCTCTEKHLVVEGGFTKASATYTDRLASQIAKVLYEGITATRRAVRERSDLEVRGLECQLANEVMISSTWKTRRVWKFKKQSHINILEEASLLKLCNLIAREPTPIRVCVMVDSNVVKCATLKGRTASRGLGPVLRRVGALCVAAGIYLNIPYSPTRLNVADDPTRDRTPRPAGSSLELCGWTRDEIFDLAALPKLKRWASNWVRLVLLTLGPQTLKLHDRSLFRQGEVRPAAWFNPWGNTNMKFDCTKGYPGEGPTASNTFFLFSCIIALLILLCITAGPGRWILNTGHFLPAPPMRSCLAFCFLSVFPSLQGAVLAGVLLGSCDGAMAAPLYATTPGEKRKAALRSQKAPLQLGRQVTETTVKARERFWEAFRNWALGAGYDLDFMLANHQACIDEINIVLVKYGRLLYDAGKSYYQYAETLNSLSSKKPALRRMLQQSWDLGYSWVRSEPSTHHVAMPPAILIAMITLSLLWGWVRVAGCLALSFGALLRPGELLGAMRRDLLLPSDLGGSVPFALLSIKEPKNRFTYARHQTAKADSSDLVKVIEFAFAKIPETERLWPLGPQTLRNRFKSLLRALQLPSENPSHPKALDLGSLRSGGATFIIQMTENTELCRRRGRWANPRMMDIYVQEVMALQYMKLLTSSGRQLILDVAKCFSNVFDNAMQFQKAQIPTSHWYNLFSQ